VGTAGRGGQPLHYARSSRLDRGRAAGPCAGGA
jgi:hypothetical protein